MLYQKAGYQKRALELCFSARLFDALRKIADDLSADSDPEVLAKCAGPRLLGGGDLRRCAARGAMPHAPCRRRGLDLFGNSARRDGHA